MKTINNILSLLLLSVVVVACSRNYDAPPLNKPEYDGPEANITIGELKKMYADVEQGSPRLIDTEYVLKAHVIGNDVSGNVFKQLYIQDGTGAINIGVDQNNMATQFYFGQEIYINLHGLYIVEYGKELQIGYNDTQANRIPWTMFNDHTKLNGWPNPKLVEAKTADMSSLTDAMVNSLVRFDNVYFVDGGLKPYTEGNQTTNRTLKDASGKSIVVRTSSYSDFAADILPKGNGSVVGLLGRHMGTWQLILRSADDVTGFDGTTPGETPGEPEVPTDPETPGDKTYFKETFGDAFYESSNRPKINDFKDGDMKAPIKYSDATGVADIRSMKGDNGPHVWLPAGKDSEFVIEGIDLSKGKEVVLSYEITANLYDAGSKADLNAIAVKVNGVDMNVPSKEISNAAGDNNKFFTVTLAPIPAEKDVKIEFISKGDVNTIGFRLDNIVLSEKK